MATNTGLGEDSPLPDAASVSPSSTTNQPGDEISLSFVPKYKFVTPTSSRSHRPARKIPPPPPEPKPPTPAAPSSARSRARSWAAAAVKTVKSVEVLRSRKSTNTLKRSSRKRRGSAGELRVQPKYHLISIAHSTPRSVSTGAVNQYCEREDIPPLPTPRIDKALPCEKPLPRTPNIKLEPELSPATSRGLIDAEERPLHRFPPGMPGAKEDWPILAPSKPFIPTDKESSEDQLPAMTSKEEPENTPCAVKLFGDAASRLAGSFVPSSAPTPTPVSGDSDAAVIAAEAPSQPQPLPALETTEQSTKSFPVTQGSNPFRNKPRALASLGSPPATPVNRNFSYTFDSQRRSVASRFRDVSNGENENISDRMGATDSPTPTDRKGPMSKIPRISPGVSPIDAAFTTGVNRPMSPALSSAQRSSIPIPSRFRHTHKAGHAPTTPVKQDLIPMTPDNQEKVSAPAAGNPKQPEVTKSQANDGPSRVMGFAQDTDESDSRPDDQPNSEYTTETGIRVKQLSHMSPSGGPQLRISSEADKIIMGRIDARPSGKEANSAQGRWRLDDNRDVRVSADSLFGSVGAKRDYKPQSRASLGNMSTPEPMAEQSASKQISKMKSADLSFNSPSPSNSAIGAKKLLEKDVNMPPMPKTSNNPFFNKIMTKSSSFIAKYGQEEQNDGDKEPERVQKQTEGPTAPLNETTNGVNTGDTSSKNTKKMEIPPPKAKRVPERLDITKRQTGMRRGSPRTNRPQRVSSYRSPDRSAYRIAADHAQQSKSKIARPMPTLVGTQATASYGSEVDGKPSNTQSPRPPVYSVATPQELTKPKTLGTKGVLSNFRGLFSKHKPDSVKETSIATPAHHNERLSRKSKASLNGNRASNRSPVRYYQAIFGTDREIQASQESQNRNASSSTDPAASQYAPAFADTRNVSALAMEVLNSVHAEEDDARKEKLVKLGQILIEAVNHSNDAEKAMISAIQAAKQAEVSCALAKENAMRVGHFARELLGPNFSATRA